MSHKRFKSRSPLPTTEQSLSDGRASCASTLAHPLGITAITRDRAVAYSHARILRDEQSKDFRLVRQRVKPCPNHG